MVNVNSSFKIIKIIDILPTSPCINNEIVRVDVGPVIFREKNTRQVRHS